MTLGETQYPEGRDNFVTAERNRGAFSSAQFGSAFAGGDYALDNFRDAVAGFMAPKFVSAQ